MVKLYNCPKCGDYYKECLNCHKVMNVNNFKRVGKYYKNTCKKCFNNRPKHNTTILYFDGASKSDNVKNKIIQHINERQQLKTNLKVGLRLLNDANLKEICNEIINLRIKQSINNGNNMFK